MKLLVLPPLRSGFSYQEVVSTHSRSSIASSSFWVLNCTDIPEGHVNISRNRHLSYPTIEPPLVTMPSFANRLFDPAVSRGCIFNGPDEWATLRTYMPEAFYPIAEYENEFGVTIHRTLTVNEQADRGVPHPCSLEMLLLAESTDYYANIIVEAEDWVLPPGAYKKGNGPT